MSISWLPFLGILLTPRRITLGKQQVVYLWQQLRLVERIVTEIHIKIKTTTNAQRLTG